MPLLYFASRFSDGKAGTDNANFFKLEVVVTKHATTVVG